MKKNWPINNLESVRECPYCDSMSSNMVHSNVEDVSFRVAPGVWNFHQCANCSSLYLNPRPTEDSIHNAYKDYYTHNKQSSLSTLSLLRFRIKNDWLSYHLNCEVAPRLNIPKRIIGFLSLVFNKPLPYWIKLLGKNDKIKGNFLDMGCGSGSSVRLAHQAGWNALGIDIDSRAVQAANNEEIRVIQGDYKTLENYKEYFDYILCSHVLVHVHNPIEFLEKLSNSVASGGVIVLSLPNSTSMLRERFGNNWRGLEAPRHLTIPSQVQLINIMKSLKFDVQSFADSGRDTAIESLRIERRSMKSNIFDILKAWLMNIRPNPDKNTNDFIKLVCTKL